MRPAHSSSEHVSTEQRIEHAPDSVPHDASVFLFKDMPLRVCVQSKVDHAGTVVGLEALTRTVNNASVPGDFFRNAEENGTIHELTTEVLRAVCEEVAHIDPDDAVPISVNVSPTELTHQFLDTIQAVLTDTGADPALLELEITEGHPIHAKQASILKELCDMNFHIALDDFGTGHATAAALQKLKEAGVRVQTVKLDQELVRNGTAPAVAEQLLNEGYRVVAEGIETLDDCEKLPERCILQGYITGKPVAAHTFFTKK